ncbi:hypothetical protein ASF60_22285 [Methylobacterium sp. Leaf113]|uniref:hypothetical protein n=1 Tax=Methylobacterium sp. Leaf113 TaxID=1736259 RepID=UPI000700C365|nr:hypothetical protein [Methylobacterium sp. Leaf113]KQP81760.1 hypothetical protein ASF60_22285 [Methylobacterium sp. Leaf113]
MKLFGTKTHAHEHLTKCEREHGIAVTALAGAETAYARATEAYDAALGQGREDALAARRAQGDAEVDRDIARRSVETAAARLETARAAVAAAETERLSATALARSREFEIATTRDLKMMASLARNLARLYAAAEVARDEAIRGGVKESDLPPVEAFRGVSGFPRQELESKRVERWIHPFTLNPLDDEETTRVRVMSGDAYLTQSGDSIRLSRKAVFDRIVVLDEQRPRRFESFLTSLAVPGLMADDVAGWVPPESLYPYAVLARLTALEEAPAPDRADRRERQIVLRPVPDAEVADAQSRRSEAA